MVESGETVRLRGPGELSEPPKRVPAAGVYIAVSATGDAAANDVRQVA